MRIPRTLSIFQIFFAYLMRQKAIFSFFCEFLEDFKFYENRNNIFESGSLKAFFRQSFRIFVFSNLASHSRYFQSVTLKHSLTFLTICKFGIVTWSFFIPGMSFVSPTMFQIKKLTGMHNKETYTRIHMRMCAHVDICVCTKYAHIIQ